MRSVKLETFYEKFNAQLRERYPSYQLGEYFNSDCSTMSWLGIFDHDYRPWLRVAEVIAVEKFTSINDTPNLLIIDYVNSNSRRYMDVEQALSFMESILIVASDRKKANENEGEWQPWNHIPISADKITAGTIGDINKVYLVTGRRNGKTMFYQNVLKNIFGFKIRDVIFNDPATVVFWGDGEKTVVQCQNGEVFDPEKGLAMAISKKIYGNKHAYYDIFKKWIGKYKKKKVKTEMNDPIEFISNGHRYVRDDIIQDLIKQALDDAASAAKNPREGQNFNDYLAEQLKDPEFKKQYENTEIINEEGNDNET